MTDKEIDRIAAAYERTGLLGTIPAAKRMEVTAQCLGLTVEQVEQALKLAEVLE